MNSTSKAPLISRITGLKESIKKSKEEILNLDKKINFDKSNFHAEVKRKNHENNENFMISNYDRKDEHEADVKLTEIFQSSANRQCIDTLAEQNDIIIKEKCEKYKIELLDINDIEISKRIEDYKNDFHNYLIGILKEDSDKHSMKLSTEILNHKKRVSTFQISSSYKD